MCKIVVSEFMSLDGVMQAPGGANEDTDGDFARGGWTLPYWHDEIGAEFFRLMGETGAFLLGRKTWQIHGGAFEHMTAGDPFVDQMNAMPKYVVSNTLMSAAAWRNSILLSGNVLAQIRALKAQPGKHISIDGSSVLIQALAQHHLIDEYHLIVYPTVLGGGKRVFPDGMHLDLQLVEARPLPTGVVLTHYVVTRPA